LAREDHSPNVVPPNCFLKERSYIIACPERVWVWSGRPPPPPPCIPQNCPATEEPPRPPPCHPTENVVVPQFSENHSRIPCNPRGEVWGCPHILPGHRRIVVAGSPPCRRAPRRYRRPTPYPSFCSCSPPPFTFLSCPLSGIWGLKPPPDCKIGGDGLGRESHLTLGPNAPKRLHNQQVAGPPVG